MAYPVIEGSTNGITSYNSSLTIPMPSSVAYDEFIIGFVATELNASCTGIDSSSGNFTVTSSIGDAYSHIYLTCFFGRALGSSNDNITLGFSNSTYASYIVYRISGHGMISTIDFSWNYGGTVYHSSDFPMKGITVLGTADKLFLTAVTYSQSATSITAPSGFSNLIDNNYDGTESDGRNGVATATLFTNGNVVSDSTWVYSNHETQTSVSITVMIKSGSYPGATPSGIGIVVPNSRIGIN